ncbi:MAG: tRNA-dependent cyclodipeptide synthase [Candidatus Micrarchaeota archaeon]|nr:tRNA-dependent cyclodipeptide synthase [Candidatus Micrarchaeota archaeon]
MEIALIWMSAGNSYFDKETIEKLLNYADEKFQKIIIISPNKPAEHTFKALGYPENKAKQKAKLNANLLKNRAEKELEKIGHRNKFSFANWETGILTSPEYNAKYKEITTIYETNPKFKNDARNTTQNVIKDKTNKITDVEKAIDQAVLYLMEELAFVLASPVIYNVQKVTYLYHRPWKIYENLISGKYDGKKKENLSFRLTNLE